MEALEGTRKAQTSQATINEVGLEDTIKIFGK